MPAKTKTAFTGSSFWGDDVFKIYRLFDVFILIGSKVL